MNHNDIAPKLTPKDYALLLKQCGIKYRSHDQWLQVGKPAKTNIWLLHITVSVIQAHELLKQILPVIKNVPFKLIKNTTAHSNLNGGAFGVNYIGKMLTLYPATDEQAKEITDLLLPATEQANGVRLYDAIPLNKSLYVAAGSEKETACPFAPGKTYPPVKHKKFFNRFYVLYGNLNFSPKGNVYKAAYWPTLTWCIIKHAPPCIAEDYTGRDARHRLQWEYRILQKINNSVPSPMAKGFINKGEDCYLVAEHIDGTTLEKRVTELMNGCTWQQLNAPVKQLLIDYYLQVVTIASKLHAVGIIFRDLKPGNFIVSPKGKLFAIDFEIAYDVNEQQPNPPFFFGDPSYTAPEQYRYATPTIKEDIFSLGATLVFLLTGKDPATVVVTNRMQAKNNLLSLTNEPALTELILYCMEVLPGHRPALAEIAERVNTLTNEYRVLLKTA